VVDTAFAQRRKTLRNTLRALGTSERIEVVAAETGVDLSGRAEELGPEDFVRLTAALDAHG
jgi:16S rRNA (adenine1518-N6/adenine1519-N6)-dimethyltransferase